MYAVNAMRFNPKNGYFATVGSDGIYCTWNKVMHNIHIHTHAHTHAHQTQRNAHVQQTKCIKSILNFAAHTYVCLSACLFVVQMK